MTEESIAGMTDKMHQMERDIMALSQRISESDPRDQRPGYQETAIGPRHLERSGCEKSLAELLSHLESISAEMVRSGTTEQLKRDGDSLRRDLDAQLKAELTLVQRIESMERTIQWLSDKAADENTEQEQVDNQGAIIADVKARLPNPDEASIETTIECKKSERARRRSSGDVKKDSFGPHPQRPRSKSIGRFTMNKVLGQPQRLREEPLEASPTSGQSSSPPRKESLTYLADQQRPKKKMLSKRRSLTNKLTGLSIDPRLSGDRETHPSISGAAGQESLKRPGLAAAAGSKKALIDVNQFPKEDSSQNAESSTPSLPPSPPEGRLSKSKTFVAEKHAALKRGKVNSTDNKVFTESFQETRNESDGSSLDAKKRELRKRKPRLKSCTQNAPASKDIARNKDEERAPECAGERSPVPNEMSSIGSGVGDWDCLSKVDSPTSQIDKAADPEGTETEHLSRKQHNLERQKRRQSKESKRNPPFRRHKRIPSKESNTSSSSSSGDASTVGKKQTGTDAPLPPTCDTAANEHDQQREGQPGHQGVVRAAVEAVARTVIGAAAMAAGVGSPKSQASVDGNVPAASSSSPHESNNDLASDIPAGKADSVKAEGKQLSRKSSKAKLVEKKQSSLSELNKSEDNAGLKSRKSSKDSGDTAAEEHDQQQEGQPGHQGVVRAAVEAVAQTVLGAAAVAAGVGSPKSQASVDGKVPAASSSPHESSNDHASDIPAGTADSAMADGKRLSRKLSKVKLAEKKQSSSSELKKIEDNAGLQSRKSSEASGEWKVTISSKEDVSVQRTPSGQTVVVTPKRPEKAEMAKAAAVKVKPRPKKGEGINSEKFAQRQSRQDDLIPKPGMYPAARPPRDHNPAAKSKVSKGQEVVPEIITSAHQVNESLVFLNVA